MPADVLDIFKVPEIASSMRINAQINVLDSIHYLKQRIKYAFFFENQIRFAKRIVMSKTETLTEETLSIIQNEIRKINPLLPVHIKAWDLMSAEELIGLVSTEDPIWEAETGKTEGSPKLKKSLPASNSMSYKKTSAASNHPSEFLLVHIHILESILRSNLSVSCWKAFRTLRGARLYGRRVL